MIIKNVNLETVAGPTSVLPKNSLPEIAFAGKSNVGKSSLINALMNRKSLARTSQKPGKTQTINYYNVNDQLYLVDLPGYGYASSSEAEKAAWGRMVENYLNTSKGLRQIFLLVDIRHDPNANDIQMYNWIRAHHYDPVIIATKLDKIKKSQLNAQVRSLENTLRVKPGTVVIPFSAQTKQGREDIWNLIEQKLADSGEIL